MISIPDSTYERYRGTEIGGGRGFTRGREMLRGRADVVVESTNALKRELEKDSTQRIFLDPDTTFDLSGENIDINGHTVYSDRGINGSRGALVKCDTMGMNSTAFDGGSGGRGVIRFSGDDWKISGFRLRGPGMEQYDSPLYPGYIPMMDRSDRRKRHSCAGTIYSDGTVENMEVFGWTTFAFKFHSGGKPNVDFRGCVFHNQFMTSYGYSIDIDGGKATVQHCYFQAARHQIAGYGYADCHFEIKDSVFGEITSSHVIDMHGLHNNWSDSKTTSDPNDRYYKQRAGGAMSVERCTFYNMRVIEDANFDAGRLAWPVSIRGVPKDYFRATRNQFVQDGPQTRNYGIRSFSKPKAAATQGPIPDRFLESSGTDRTPAGFSTNFELYDNEWNTDHDHGSDYGAQFRENPPTFESSRPEPPFTPDERESRARAVRRIQESL